MAERQAARRESTAAGHRALGTPPVLDDPETRVVIREQRHQRIAFWIMVLLAVLCAIFEV